RTAWSAKVGESGPYVLVPASAGTAVIAASTGGEVSAYEASSGKPLWRTDLKLKISAGVATDNEIAIVGASDGQAAAVSVKDGSLKWKVNLPAELLGMPAITRGMAVFHSSDARLFGLDAATGERKWTLQRPLPALVLRSDAGVSPAGDLVYASF